jgi:hypothetical protein
MDVRILSLLATVIDACKEPETGGRGRPPAPTVQVLATLRRFLRAGVGWRDLKASPTEASGSTLRRCLARAVRFSESVVIERGE